MTSTTSDGSALGSSASAGSAPRPGWHKLAYGGLLALLVWAPVPLGSNRPWALGLLAAGLWALVALHLGGAAASGAGSHGRRLARGAWPLALMAGFCALVWGQTLALNTTEGATGLAGLLGTQDVYSTRLYLLTALAYLGGFVLVLLCVGTPERASQLLAVLVLGGVLQAVLAVGLYASGASYSFLYEDFQQGGRVSGTFPNPDHLAGYLELTLSAGLGLMLAQFGGLAGGKRSWKQRLVAALQFMMSRKMILRMVLVVMVVSLVMTRSRMGNGAFFLALVLVGLVVAMVSQRLRRPALWLVVSMAIVDVLIVGQLVGLDKLVDRMKGTAESTVVDARGLDDDASVVAVRRKEESIQERLQVPLLSLPLVAQAPWFGHGGGTYALSFAPIKPEGYPLYWNHAHNDFVEIAADTGLVGLGLLLLLACTTAWRAARMLRDSQPRLNRGVGAAALMGLCCMLLHSLVDFNLQIPANALTLVVLLALVWALPQVPTGAASAKPGAA